MIKDDILRLLIKSRSGYVSGGELAERFKLSRTAIWKHIKTLRQDGYLLEAVPSKGYRLVKIPDMIDLDAVRQGLVARRIGAEIQLFPEVESTNTRAMDLAQAGAPEGTVIVAEQQTGGKGRLGRSWISPRGNLYVSVILRPDIPPHQAPAITLMGAVAAALAIREQTGLAAGIKWPNDIFLSGKKVGGLLTEMSAEPDRVKHIVLGIGIDVNMDPGLLPDELRPQVTTLAAETLGPVDRSLLLQRLLAELDRWYGTFLANEGAVLREWESLNITLGRRVSIHSGGASFEGTAEAIDSNGRLIVKRDDGSFHPLASGDVVLKGEKGQ